MDKQEVRDLLDKMGALGSSDSDLSVNAQALMADPIVSNKLAVELLRKLDRESKPELVLSLPGIDSYFAYNVALSAWMRFGICETLGQEVSASLSIKKNEKVVIVLDTYNEAIAQKIISFVESKNAKVVAVLSLVGSDTSIDKILCHCLI